MLEITIPKREFFNEQTSEIFEIEEKKLVLEHSLVSLSKWESKWHKPFLTKGKLTREETIDYIRCMTITQNVDPLMYNGIGNDIIDQVTRYIEDPMSATTFSKEQNQKFNREIITAEIIYYWMVSFNIPSEYQRWHLNRLLTLINVCNIKNQPKKTMSRKQLMSQNRALNAARRKQLNTSG